MRKRTLILTALVFALILTSTIQPAIAYFTTYVRARGGYTVSIGDTTKIRERYSDWTKHVVISNEEGSEPVFIRARVLYSGKYGVSVSGEGWTERNDDGYYYYGSSATALTIVEGGKETTALDVTITGVPVVPTENNETDAEVEEAFKRLKDGEGFSVTVIYESTPVRYQEDGTAYADWDAKVIEVDSTTGGSGR